MNRARHEHRRGNSERARYILGWLDRHQHFGGSDCNRVATLCREVLRASYPIARGQPGFNLVDVAMTDLLEFEGIAETLGPILDVGPIRAKLARSLHNDGPLPPDDATRNSNGRDAQWELVVAATLVRAGGSLNPTPADENALPDWQVRMPRSMIWAVEAKCVKSRNENRIVSATTDAIGQIERTSKPGIVMVDLTRRGNPTLTSVPSEATNERLREFHHQQGEELELLLRSRVLNRVQSHYTAFFAFRDQIPRSASRDRAASAGLIACWNFVMNPHFDKHLAREAERLWRRLGWAQPGNRLESSVTGRASRWAPPPPPAIQMSVVL